MQSIAVKNGCKIRSHGDPLNNCKVFLSKFQTQQCGLSVLDIASFGRNHLKLIFLITVYQFLTSTAIYFHSSMQIFFTCVMLEGFQPISNYLTVSWRDLLQIKTLIRSFQITPFLFSFLFFPPSHSLTRSIAMFRVIRH